MSREDWFWETTRPSSELIQEYGYDRLSLIEYLDEEGLWDDRDWHDWNEITGGES
jgi:hypothetical protein